MLTLYAHSLCALFERSVICDLCSSLSALASMRFRQRSLAVYHIACDGPHVSLSLSLSLIDRVCPIGCASLIGCVPLCVGPTLSVSLCVCMFAAHVCIRIENGGYPETT